MKIRFKEKFGHHLPGQVYCADSYVYSASELIRDDVAEVVPEYNPYEPQGRWTDEDMKEFAYFMYIRNKDTHPSLMNPRRIDDELHHWKNHVIPCTEHPKPKDVVAIEAESIQKELSQLVDKINVEATARTTYPGPTPTNWKMLQGLSHLVQRMAWVLNKECKK